MVLAGIVGVCPLPSERRSRCNSCRLGPRRGKRSVPASARGRAPGDGVGSARGELLGPADSRFGCSAAADESLRRSSHSRTVCTAPTAGLHATVMQRMQPLTRPTGCFSVTAHKEGHHGTLGQKLHQTSPQNQKDETSQLPPLRPRIFVGGAASPPVPNVPPGHRRFAVAGRRVQRRTPPRPWGTRGEIERFDLGLRARCRGTWSLAPEVIETPVAQAQPRGFVCSALKS
jgi:hypothetical protein